MKWLILNWTISITFQYLKPLNCVEIELLVLDDNPWNHLNACKQMSTSSFKEDYLYTIYFQIMYKQDTTLNNPQWLICHTTQITNNIYLSISFYLSLSLSFSLSLSLSIYIYIYKHCNQPISVYSYLSIFSFDVFGIFVCILIYSYISIGVTHR